MHRLKNPLMSVLNLCFVAFCLGVIIWLNFLIIASWFGGNGPANLGSIEVSYVSMGRFLVDFGLPFPGGSSFAPFWYFGFPFHLFYTPLLPMLEALIHKIAGMPFWETYRLLTGIAYILGPVSVFFLGWQLSRRVIGGLLAGIFYSVGPTIFYFIDSGVAGDKFSDYFWDPRRFTILVRWGEGPHLFSLMFLPLAASFFTRALNANRLRWVVISAIFLGLTALSNAIGFFAALLLLFSMAFVKIAQDRATAKSAAISLLSTLAVSLGLISFWYNLSFIENFFGEGGSLLGTYLSLFPWGAIGLTLGIILVYFVFRKWIKSFAIGCSLLWFAILFLVVALYYLSAPAEESYRRIELLPQALRYMVEVDLSFSLLSAVLFAGIVGLLGKKLYILEIIGNVAAVLGVLGLVWYIQPFIPVASKAVGASVDINSTQEYRIASWLDSKIDQTKGERIFIPGNYGFYLNYATNVWQHRGALFQAATHPWVEHMHYQIANGTDPDISRAWFIIGNTKYAVITATGSSELYKEIKNLYRFEQFPIAQREGGDIIYKVPLKRSSLAKPVDISQLSSLSAPIKADDKKPLLAYAQWVESSSNNQTELTMVNNDTYRISGKVSKGEGVLVQMTADPGWRALRRSAPQGKLEKIKTGKDPMGFLMLYPDSGNIDITLTHGPSWKQWLGYMTTTATIAFIVLNGFRKIRLFSDRRIQSQVV